MAFLRGAFPSRGGGEVCSLSAFLSSLSVVSQSVEHPERANKLSFELEPCFRLGQAQGVSFPVTGCQLASCSLCSQLESVSRTPVLYSKRVDIGGNWLGKTLPSGTEKDRDCQRRGRLLLVTPHGVDPTGPEAAVSSGILGMCRYFSSIVLAP